MRRIFEEKIIDEFVELHLRLHYPRVSGGYQSGMDGTYKRLKDEIKMEHLKEIVNLNPEWDLEKMSQSASEKIRVKTNIY